MSGESPEIVEYPRQDEAIRDGIDEEDNPIPLWFNVTFYASIVFGVIYILYYTLSGWSQLGEYEAQVAAAEVRAEAVRASLPTTNPFRGDAVEGWGVGDVVDKAHALVLHLVAHQDQDVGVCGHGILRVGRISGVGRKAK